MGGCTSTSKAGDPAAANSPAATGAESKGFNAKFNQMHLDAHNKYRQEHQAGPMTIDEDLARGAQAYAEELSKANKMAHSQGDYGENLAMHSSE